MKCKKCNSSMEMELGKAIDPKREELSIYIMPRGNLKYEDIELIDVWKCPECGHSENIDHFKEGQDDIDWSEIGKIKLPRTITVRKPYPWERSPSELQLKSHTSGLYPQYKGDKET